MSEMLDYLNRIFEENIFKIVLSNAKKVNESYKKIVIEKKEEYYQISRYTSKQVFHENVKKENLYIAILYSLENEFIQLNAWSEKNEHSIKISKKGKIFYNKIKQNNINKLAKIQSTHNRKKEYIFEEGKAIDVLIDMGIFTKEGKVVSSMYDKYKQINRFIEIIDDVVKKENYKSLNIIDFGCGKSYLSFLVYHYFRYIKNININMIGLDLKEDVIEKCNKAAKKYSYDTLKFEIGDINGYEAKFDVDIVISLHACDTATDYALFNAINWGAKMIFSVPCCQHEIAKQIKTDRYKLLTGYGLIKERFSDLLTDSIRANLLEYKSYDTKILEFVDFSHTPKNILIRAILNKSKSKAVKEEKFSEVAKIVEEYNINPCLWRLIKD